MPYDFGLLDKKIIIELDGEQHFSQVSNWDSPERVQEKDIEKIKYCIDNGYSIIHIYQNDVWRDIYDWKQILTECIENIINIPKVIFISSNNVYIQHKDMLDERICSEIITPKNLKLL